MWFEEVGKEDVSLVGGKGANLGEMTTANLPIPYGFIITSYAYYNFIHKARLGPRIKDALSLVNFENPGELQQASSHIQDMILNAEMPAELAEKIVEYYDNLSAKEESYLTNKYSFLHFTYNKLKTLYKQPLVAVRSSATAEDLPTASFAGQQETYLNVKGDAHLLQKVKECWASLFTQRAIYYRHQQGFDHFKVGLATVVQRMVQSDISGIAFSIDPVTNDKTKIVIEAVYGLGEYIVQGKVTPDHYEVDKRSFVILKNEQAYQDVKFVRDGSGNKEIKLSKKEGSTQKMSEEEILKIAMLVKDIEKHYYFPQDIEWAIEKERAFIVQSRPITTMKEESVQNGMVVNTSSSALEQKHKMLLLGSPASPGIGVGPVQIILSPAEIGKIKQGDILVAPQTNPDYVPAMRKAAGIITEKGGRTSHAAIVSRELGIPAVVGADAATKVLSNGMVVSVNGALGEVYKGSIIAKPLKAEKQEIETEMVLELYKERHKDIGIEAEVVIEQPKKSEAMVAAEQLEEVHIEKPKHLKTITKVYVNLAEPDIAEKISDMDIDGVGLLRAEFMIAEIGTHPKEFIKQKQEKVFIKKLVQNMERFMKAFPGKPIVYRATDFKSNEYRNLKGGALYEPEEGNPMIGYRGASRYVADPDVFSLELQAIREIWEKGYKNLHLMVPFVRVPWELIRIKEIITDFGLFNYHGFKLWMMVEVPAAAIMLEDFIKIGIDGVSIGTNDLTMMLLGVDRDSTEVSHIYDERNEAVVKVLNQIVETCAKNNVTCSICGQAASDYPELIENLVQKGITSVSVTPDALNRTRALIYGIEKKLHDINKLAEKEEEKPSKTKKDDKKDTDDKKKILKKK